METSLHQCHPEGRGLRLLRKPGGQALLQIGRIYQIERQVQEASADERLRMRQLQTRPVIDKLPSSKIAELLPHRWAQKSSGHASC